jgi:hypothetical protein
MNARIVLLLTSLLVCSVSAQNVTFTQLAKTEVPFGAAVRLLPDGKRMYWIDREQNANGERAYAYYIGNVDGTGKRKLFDTVIAMDDIFAFSMGSGCISPSSKKLAVMTTDTGQPWRGRAAGGQPIVVIIDDQGKELRRLPTEFGIITAPLFVDENTVVFCDNTNPDGNRHQVQTKLQRMDLTTGKVETIRHFKDRFATCLQLSPNRKRVAGIAAQFDEPDRMDLFVLELADGEVNQVEFGSPSDGYFDDAPWFVWSGDSRSVFGTAEKAGTTLLCRFTPHAEGDAQLAVVNLSDGGAAAAPIAEAAGNELTKAQTQQAAKLIDQLSAMGFDEREKAEQALIAMGKAVLPLVEKAKTSDDAEVALRAERIEREIKDLPDPDTPPTERREEYALVALLDDKRLSVVKIDTHYEKTAYALNTKTLKATVLPGLMLVVDRVGDRVIVADMNERKVYSATVDIKP